MSVLSRNSMSRRKLRAYLASTMIACTLVAQLDLLPAHAIVYNAGTIEVSDTTPGASPSIRVSYKLTVDRHGSAGENFFYFYKPAGFPNLAVKNCAEIKALTTVKVNGVTMDNDTFIDTGICATWTGGVQLRLKAGVKLDKDDIVQVTLDTGVFVNPNSSSTTTWTWRTCDSSGADSDWFSSTMLTGDVSIMASTTTTLAPSARTTTTTAAPTTTTVAAPTTTVASSATTVAAPTSTIGTATAEGNSSAQAQAVSVDAQDENEDLSSSGSNTDFQLHLALLLLAVGVLVARRRLLA